MFRAFTRCADVAVEKNLPPKASFIGAAAA
jgi:hypothetical protein